MPLKLSEFSTETIIESYNSYLFKNGSLSEQYIQLSNFHIKNMKEYNELIIEHSNLCKNLSLSIYESSVPYTYNQLRTESSRKMHYNQHSEELLLKIYMQTHGIFHLLSTKLKKIQTLTKISPKSSMHLKNLANLLANIKKYGRKTLFTIVSNQTLNIVNNSVLLQYLKINIGDISSKLFPVDVKSRKLLQ